MKQKYIMRPKGDLTQGLIDMCCFVEKSNRKVLVEIGSYSGESTVIFSDFFEKIYAIDPWQNNYSEGDIASTIQDFKEIENLFDKRIYGKNIIKIKSKGEDSLGLFDEKSIDVVYIDGNHEVKNVVSDIKNWIPKIKTGGYIAGHDYYLPKSNVMEAVNNVLGVPDKIFSDSSWIKKIV
jgi:cephalosporin hydroxylase